MKCTRGDGAGDFGALYRALRLDVAGLIREMVTRGLHRLHAAAKLWRGRPLTMAVHFDSVARVLA